MREIAGAIAFIAALLVTISDTQAFDDARYPNLEGQWERVRLPGVVGNPGFDPTRPAGRAQQAPLTQEYRAVFEANLAELAAGGGGLDASYRCMAQGMPMVMQLYAPAEIIVMPDTTYILIDEVHQEQRRIYTDGRDWPKEIEPSYIGYSIGKWVDEDGDGRYGTLEIETRFFKGPRVYEGTIPLHADNQSVIKERIFFNKADPNILHDEITVIDHGLTHPWVVTKSYRRNPNPRPVWREFICAENNPHVRIGKEDYMLSAEGVLMPAKKNQAPPDLRYFKQP
jgi:hypothetical protein